MKASNIDLSGNTQFLFKGSPGFGKTLAAASFALQGPVYLSYWDKKSPVELKTFFTEKRFGDKAKKILDNIEYDVYGSENAAEYLNKLIEFATRGCRYTAIINDSITYMTSAAVNWSMNFGKDPKANKKIKDIIPSFDEYKVETSLVSQCMDISRKLPCHVIWTAHPVPRINVESNLTVTKTNSLVAYGNKVAGLLPGGFTEIYHFSQRSDFSLADGKASKRYIVNTEAIGDEFAKSPLLADHVKEFDVTDQLFYEVWSDLIRKSQNIPEPIESTIPNPFESKWKTS